MKYVKLNAEESNLEKVIKSYLPAIKSIIARIEIEETEDLIQVGYLAILESINSGRAESTDILTRILYDINRYLMREYPFSGLSKKRKTIENIRTIMNSITKKDMEGIELDPDGRASEFILVEVKPYYRDNVSDKTAESTEEIDLRNHEKATVLSFINLLLPKEQELMIKHYGLLGEKPMSLHELADFYGVSYARITYVHNRALNKLRYCMDNLPEKSGKKAKNGQELKLIRVAKYGCIKLY